MQVRDTQTDCRRNQKNQSKKTPSMLMKSLRHWLIVASRTFLWLWTSMRSFHRFCCSARAPKWNQRNMGSTSTSHLVKHSNQSTFRYPQFNRGSRWHTVNMDLPKTTSPKMKTTKKMNNVQSQTKIKLHQLIRKILARYLYSSLDPLQRKKTLQQITPNKNQNLQF